VQRLLSMRPAAVAVVMLVISSAFAGSAAAAPSENPFVGSWVSDDLPEGTVIRLQIGRGGHFHSWDEVTLGTGGLVTSSGFGDFTLDGDPQGFSVVGDRYSHTRDGSGRVFLGTTNPADDAFSFTYDPVLDVLNLVIDGGCYYRQGTDSATSCDVQP
jgi:hypothetical protein